MLPILPESFPTFQTIQDVILYSHNKASEEEKRIFSQEVDPEELMLQLMRNYGVQHIDIVMRTIVSLMGRYQDSSVEDGELISLEENDFEVGLKIFERNTVNNDLVYPVLVYALAYANSLLNYLQENNPLLDSIFPKNLDFSDKITILVGVGIQHRFWYLRKLDIQRILWGEKFQGIEEDTDKEILLSSIQKISTLWTKPEEKV